MVQTEIGLTWRCLRAPIRVDNVLHIVFCVRKYLLLIPSYVVVLKSDHRHSLI